MINVTLNNGELRIEGFDTSDYKTFFNRFRADLVDANIPHYRVIAVECNHEHARKVVSQVEKIKGLGYSYAELSFIFDKIIMSRRCGKLPTIFENSIIADELSNNYGFIGLNGNDIGSMFDYSIYELGEGVSAKPQMLLKNTELLRNLKDSMTFTVILKRHFGLMDFKESHRQYRTSLETQRSINNQFKPLRANYKLYDVFSVQEYLSGSFIKLNYIQDVNENVLQEIIEDYINELDL